MVYFAGEISYQLADKYIRVIYISVSQPPGRVPVPGLKIFLKPYNLDILLYKSFYFVILANY